MTVENIFFAATTLFCSFIKSVFNKSFILQTSGVIQPFMILRYRGSTLRSWQKYDIFPIKGN
jgi:hypothetical protein